MQYGIMLVGGILLPILMVSIALGVQNLMWRCIWGALLSVSALLGIKALYLLEALLVPLILETFSLKLDLQITGTTVGNIWVGIYVVMFLVGLYTTIRGILSLKKGMKYHDEVPE